jgi:hypothetical protein
MKEMNNPEELKEVMGAHLFTNGIIHQLHSTLSLDNVSHTALSLRLPSNEETKELIEKYCVELAL